MLFLETSAKTAANCALVFETVAKKIAGYDDATSGQAAVPTPKEPATDSTTPVSRNPRPM